MDYEIIIARVILSIVTSGTVEEKSIEKIRCELNSFDKKLELFNALLISHKKRYEQCFTDELRKSEYICFMKDYSLIFGKSFIEERFVRELFSFSVSRDFHSAEFQTSCDRLIQFANKCDILEIRYAVLSHVISTIIKSRLYGKQPIDTYLQECVDSIDNMLIEHGEIRQISLLE